MENHDLGTENKPKNSKSKNIIFIVCAVVVFLIVVVVLALCLGKDSSPSSPSGTTPGSTTVTKNKLEVSGTAMSVEYNDLLGYSVRITGLAKNVSGRNLSYASVEFSVYDESGYNIGTAVANVNNIAGGDTWRFEAVLLDFSETRPVSFKLADITAW